MAVQNPTRRAGDANVHVDTAWRNTAGDKNSIRPAVMMMMMKTTIIINYILNLF
jgi:hypothetical protein